MTGEVRTIADMTPGDLVVIDESGASVYVRLGSLFGDGKRGTKNRTIQWALVTNFDPDTGRDDYSTTRFIKAEVEVVGVHQYIAHARAVRAMRSTILSASAEVDPLMSGKKDGEF